MGPLLLAHACALVLFFLAPRLWATTDAHAFSVNPADDTFHDTFHRQRLTWRVAMLAALAAVASEPADATVATFACSYLGLVAIGAAYFFYDFNPRLNRLRGLPYVGEYYVSFDPHAALFPDRWLAARARKAAPVNEALQRSYAAIELQNLLRLVLAIGSLLYLVLLALAYFLL